jgi:hypothetical protein
MTLAGSTFYPLVVRIWERVGETPNPFLCFVDRGSLYDPRQ